MIFSCGVVPDSRAVAVLEQLYVEAFDQLGYNFSIMERPGMRSLSDASQGRVDGECARYGQLADNSAFGDYSSLVRVEARLINFNINLYSYQPSPADVTVATIVDQQLKVGYQRGAIAQDKLLAKVPGKQRIQFVELVNGLRMLNAGRLHLIAAPKVLMDSAVNRTQLPAPARVGVLATYGAYPYLNEKHAALAPQLAAAIQVLLSDPNHPIHQFGE